MSNEKNTTTEEFERLAIDFLQADSELYSYTSKENLLAGLLKKNGTANSRWKKMLEIKKENSSQTSDEDTSNSPEVIDMAESTVYAIFQEFDKTLENTPQESKRKKEVEETLEIFLQMIKPNGFKIAPTEVSLTAAKSQIFGTCLRTYLKSSRTARVELKKSFNQLDCLKDNNPFVFELASIIAAKQQAREKKPETPQNFTDDFTSILSQLFPNVMPELTPKLSKIVELALLSKLTGVFDSSIEDLQLFIINAQKEDATSYLPFCPPMSYGDLGQCYAAPSLILEERDLGDVDIGMVNQPYLERIQINYFETRSQRQDLSKFDIGEVKILFADWEIPLYIAFIEELISNIDYNEVLEEIGISTKELQIYLDGYTQVLNTGKENILFQTIQNTLEAQPDNIESMMNKLFNQYLASENIKNLASTILAENKDQIVKKYTPEGLLIYKDWLRKNGMPFDFNKTETALKLMGLVWGVFEKFQYSMEAKMSGSYAVIWTTEQDAIDKYGENREIPILPIPNLKYLNDNF